MNPDTCTYPYVKDQFLFLGTNCDTSIVGFYALGGIALALRWIVSGWQWHSWIVREAYFKSRESDNKSKKRDRKPVIPMISLVSAIILTLVFALGATNQANVFNGMGALLWGIGFLCFSVNSMIYLYRMVKLGRKIIPLSRKQWKNNGTDDEQLTQFSFKGQVIFCIMVLSILAFSITLYILCPALPVVSTTNNTNFVFTKLGFCFLGVFQACYVTLVVYQLQRCIWVVEEGLGNSVVADNKTILLAIHKMKAQQLIILVLGFAGAIVLFLAGLEAGVETRYFIIFALSMNETFANFGMNFQSATAQKKKKMSKNELEITPAADTFSSSDSRPVAAVMSSDNVL